jgi:hypothetical protein
MKLYTLKCPGCGKVADHQIGGIATIKCGDCLMDRCEVVTMEVVKKGKDHEPTPNES